MTCLALSRRFGSVFAIGGSDGVVYIYNIGSTDPLLWLKTQKSLGKVVTLTFDDFEDQLCVVHESGEICVWDLETERLARNWHIKNASAVRKTAVHPFGGLLALLTHQSGSSPQIELWDLRRQSLAHVYIVGDKISTEGSAESSNFGFSLSFAPDGLSLVVGAKGGAYVFDLSAGTLKHILRDDADSNTTSIGALAFHPLEPLLVTGSTSGKVTLFDYATFSKMEIPTHQRGMSNSAISQISWSEDGTTLMALSQDNLLLWNTRRTHAIQPVETLSLEHDTGRSLSSANSGSQGIENASKGAFGSDSFRQCSYGFDSYAIVLTFEKSSKSLTTWYYNLQKLGLMTSTTSSTQISPTSPELSERKAEKSKENESSNSEPEAIDEESIFSQLTSQSNKTLYTLRNRLDHLKSLRATLSGKSAPSLLAAIAKQPSAVRSELLGELISSRLIQSSLNISPATVGPQGLAPQTNEDFGSFLLLLKQCLKHMSEHHQLASLNYLETIIPDLSFVSPEKFEVIEDEIAKLATSPPSQVSSKAAEILQALSPQ